MKSVLLVHGAWHNESCWNGVREELETKGFKVHTVTLSGNDPACDKVGTTYDEIVDSLVKKAQSIDSDFVLVGHSSAGHVIQHAAPKIKSKIEKIVFNNAWLLPDNTSQFDLVPPEIKDGMRIGADHHPRKCIPVGEEFVREILCNDTDKEIQDSLLSILVPQPISLMETKADTKEFQKLEVPMALLHSKNDISLPDNLYVKMFLGLNKGDEIVEIEGVHEALFTDPKLFTNGLIDCL